MLAGAERDSTDELLRARMGPANLYVAAMPEVIHLAALLGSQVSKSVINGAVQGLLGALDQLGGRRKPRAVVGHVLDQSDLLASVSVD